MAIAARPNRSQKPGRFRYLPRSETRGLRVSESWSHIPRKPVIRSKEHDG
ncbi:hypothetical protein NJ7G_4146 [Natrinema sp. J7-2]|nr:hypothetical protein NJ7G_4146 [Natrinema sp. J7-2]